MISFLPAPPFRLTGLLLTLFLGACVGGSSPPVRHFLITPQAEAVPTAKRHLEVAVEPVVIPSYLNRPQIVVRTGTNEFALSDDHHWVEKLSDNLTRVLAENMGMLLEPATIQVLPQVRRSPYDVKVALEVLSFEREAEGEVRLKARWRLYDGEGNLSLTRLSTHGVAASDDVPQAVEAMSRAFAQLCREIATQIRAQPETAQVKP